MVLQRPPFAALLLLSAVASSLGAIFSLRRRETPGAIPLSVIMVAAGWWAVAYTFQLASVTQGAKLFWWQVKYLGIAGIPTAFLVFVLQYTGETQWVTRRTVGLLSVVPVAHLALVWTNHQHHFYVSHATLETASGLVMLDTPIATGFWLVVGYNYLLLLVGTFLVFRMFAVTDHLFRSQTAAMLIGVSAPWLSNVLFVLNIRPAGIDITPLAFIITGIALLWAVFRHELLEIVPIPRDLAREALLETITDATFVVDENGNVVDINPAGRQIAVDEVTNPIGRPLERVFPELDELLARDRSVVTTHEEVEIKRTDENRYFDLQVSPLQGHNGHRGHIVILRDITDRARHRQRLEVMNRVLRHDIRNDINLILAHADEVLNGNGDCEERVDRIKDLAFDVVELSERARTAGESLGSTDVLDTIDLVPVIERHLDELRRDYPAADISQDLPVEGVVWAHPLIDSAVKNVIENALEHNNRDEPTLAVSIRDDADDFLDLRIVDNGPGIPDIEREVIRSGTETQVQHSSGLGLWLTNWIISESGGDVSFADNDPQGTILTVRLRDAGTEQPVET